MVRIIALKIILVIAFQQAVAQDWNNYQPIQSQGTIPVDFLESSAKRFEREVEDIDQNLTRKERKAQEYFVLSTSYLLTQMLHGGDVLFNDPVSVYANNVMTEIKKSNPAIPDEVRIYTIKSPEVNAFATDQGIIFITLGLIAQLQNEAQLAFVLCHELVHYQQRHNLDIYMEKSRIESGKGEYRDYNSSDQIMSKSLYNKEKEKEADLDGLKFFVKTPYDMEAVPGVFDVLEYSYLPFDEVAFNKSFLETAHLIFPEEYHLQEVAEIGGRANVESETHPSIDERREYVSATLEQAERKAGDVYLVSESAFEYVRKLARFEQSRLFLQQMEYGKALYNSYLLLQEEPDSKYLKKNIGYALTGLSTYANYGSKRSVLDNEDNIEGESQRLFYLLNELNDKGRTITALVYDYQLHQNYPDDKDIEIMYNRMITELIDEHEDDLDYFYTIPFDSVYNPADTLEENLDSLSSGTDNDDLDKYEKIRQKKKADKKKNLKELDYEKEYLKFALVDILKDPDFQKRFIETKEIVEKNKIEAGKNWDADPGPIAGMEKVIFVSPLYLELDTRKAQSYRYIESEEGAKNMKQLIEEEAQLTGLDLVILDYDQLGINEVVKMNDIMMLSEWFGEMLEHDDLDISTVNDPYLQQIAERYDSDYFIWNGIFSVKESAALKNIGLAILLWPAAPYFIVKAFLPEKTTYYYTLIYDVHNRELSRVMASAVDGGVGSMYLRSQLYDIMYSIKKGQL